MTSTSATPDAARTRDLLGAWFRASGRHGLPWRRLREPYPVLVSEVMLQQTQVDRVVPYYHAWLDRWPGFAELAAAASADVITAWRGLGYNRRALALHAAARAVVERHAGRFPWEPKELRALPGVGPYTAAALRCFVLDEPLPVLDTNISRVIARLALGQATARDVPRSALEAAARSFLPAQGGRDHNLALMDLGALVCTSRTPLCGSCPVSTQCRWYASGRPLPPPDRRPPAPRFEDTARFARGRIVDRLRNGPVHKAELSGILPPRHRPYLEAYLASLQRDGLAVPLGPDTWALPPG